MGRRVIYVVLIVFFVFTGCYGSDDVPFQIFLDSKWDEDEQLAIIFGMERWEDEAGINFFEFVGEFTDDEFTFEDIDDGHHVVYKLMAPNEDTLWLEDNYDCNCYAPGSKLNGYGLHTDILLYWYRFSAYYGPDDRENYLIFLSNLITHESAHFLGLGHNNVDCSRSMMAPINCTPDGEYREIADEDVEQLCVFYDCPGE